MNCPDYDAPAEPEKQTQVAFVWAGGTNASLRRVAIPQPQPGWLPIDVSFAGICGSDLHTCAGKNQRARPGTVLGHEFVGRLAQGSDVLMAGTPVFVNPMIHCNQCEPCRRGRTNACDRLTSIGLHHPGGMTARTVAPIGNVMPLPPDVDLRHAALIEPVAVCVHALNQSNFRLGCDVHIIGAGAVGCILGQLAVIAGASRVTISQRSPARAVIASDIGLEVVADVEARHQNAEIVFDTAGHASVPVQLLKWVRTGGTVVIVGVHEAGFHPLDLLTLLLREVSIVGSRVYNRQDIESAIYWVCSHRLNLEPLISDILPLSRALEGLQELREGRAMKVLIQP